jgi:ABC-type amino acid transport substrate-binding protein
MTLYRLILICFLLFTSTIQADQAEERILKVAVSIYDPPFVILGANNNFYGFDIALMERVCATINYNCQFIAMPFQELLPAVEKDKVDLAIGSIIITPERASQVTFSMPYFISRLRFLGRETEPARQITLKQLSNKKIGITDQVFSPALKNLGVNDSQIVIYPREDSLVKALNIGDIHFALLDNAAAVYWHRNSSGKLKALGVPITYGYGMGIAISPKNVSLVNPINAALLSYLNSGAFFLDFHKYLATLYDF